MAAQFTFHLLDSVDSTNNYAMALIREGLAENGMAWQARHQTAGKGQLGRAWLSEISDNILMSVAVCPRPDQTAHPFVFNMQVALVCRDFIAGMTTEKVSIKWPNDIYINDRKAGGILIENSYRGKDWLWAVIGIGMNINQNNFPADAPRAVSLCQITGHYYDPVALSRDLHHQLTSKLIHTTFDPLEIQAGYHQHLYKWNESVDFEKEGAAFKAQVNGVDEQGQLLTTAGIFKNGEVKWK